MPPSLQDGLPESHPARFVAELTNGLDLSKIYGYYGRRDGRGKAAYHPVMMVRVLLYGYCLEVMSSRRMEKASYDDIAFRYLCADQHPDHDTIADFRRQHLPVPAQIAVDGKAQVIVAAEITQESNDKRRLFSSRQAPGVGACRGMPQAAPYDAPDCAIRHSRAAQ